MYNLPHQSRLNIKLLFCCCFVLIKQQNIEHYFSNTLNSTHLNFCFLSDTQASSSAKNKPKNVEASIIIAKRKKKTQSHKDESAISLDELFWVFIMHKWKLLTDDYIFYNIFWFILKIKPVNTKQIKSKIEFIF